MKLWTYILPAAVWLWLASRHCERVNIPAGSLGIHVGRGVTIVTKHVELRSIAP